MTNIFKALRFKLFVIFFLTGVQGCAVVPPVNHVLTINKFGDAVHPESENILDKDESKAHFEKLLSSEKNNIVLYIHGGLNTPDGANKRANRLVGAMMDDNVHPIFVHWRSGLVTTYLEHAFSLRQGEYWRPVTGIATSPFIFLSDLGRSVSRIPIYWFYKFNTAAKAIFPFRYPSEKHALDVEKFATVENEYGFAEIPSLSNDKKLAPQIKDAVIDTFQFGASLFTAPLFDFFGTSSWGVMKRRTGLLFVKTRPMDGESYHDIDGFKQEREGAMAQFLDQLLLKQKTDPTLKVTLVGHSMGTIVANRILRGWPDLKIEKIVYMGAASSIDDFRQSVVRYMLAEQNQKTLFYNFMLHPVAENSEAHGLGIAGTGSLLTQIDDLYENPVLDSGRTIGRWVNVMNGLNYFDRRVRDRVHLRVMPLSDDYPTEHGDFSNSEYIKTGPFWRGKLGLLRHTKEITH